jgi:ABC-type thiamin/hydroxymethylpyrimidine transport system permease subunit
MISRKMKSNVAIYYNRKIIHIMAGGVVAFLIPLIFSSPLIPMLFALIIAIMLYIFRHKANMLNWLQTSENMNEISFCLAWGISLFVVWIITENKYYAILPALFISIGDSITGIIRNLIYGKRTKSWIGNLGMIAFTAPLGYIYSGIAGILAAIVASIVEHFEIPPYLDDNVLISLSASLVLILYP